MGALAAPRVRWGILGTGHIAGEFAMGLRRLPEAELVAIGSREAERGDRFAHAVGAPRAHGSYEALVGDPGVDVVYVATPNSEHRDHNRLALEAGKAVLCEKPFATSAAEAREVVALARAKGLFCMEAMWSRFVPLVGRAEALVREGRIGDPLAFQADLGIVVPSRASRALRPELGGGALLEFGVYLVAMARLFLGPSEETLGCAMVGPSGVDEQASVLLRHSDGGHSALFASLLSQTPGEAQLFGTRGRLRLHAPFYRPHHVSVVTFAKAGEGRAPGAAGPPAVPATWKSALRRLYQRYEAYLSPVVRRPSLDLVIPVEGNGYHHQAAEVIRCLRAGQTESGRMPLDETIAILETLDALRVSRAPVVPGP
ncbi:MAG: Gfo/Idh/MocA family oxidoreductase [Acidobacteria bacterium]|nr:Gfo/Idh/MocA family oxidoreductase [Acidobacteriota bacterium]